MWGERGRALCKWQEGPNRRAVSQEEGHSGETVASVFHATWVHRLLVAHGPLRRKEKESGAGRLKVIEITDNSSLPHGTPRIIRTRNPFPTPQALLPRTKHSNKTRRLRLNNFQSGGITVQDTSLLSLPASSAQACDHVAHPPRTTLRRTPLPLGLRLPSSHSRLITGALGMEVPHNKRRAWEMLPSPTRTETPHPEPEAPIT